MGRPLRIGLFSPYFGSTVGGGEKYLAVTAEALRDAFPQHQVEIVAPVLADRELYRHRLNVDLDGIGLVSTNRRVTSLHRLANRLGPLRPLRNLVLGSQATRASGGYDLALGMVYAIPIRPRARRNVMLCQFPYPGADPRDIGPYELIISQSEYCAGWVRRYWDREATVVNPPIDLPAAAPDWSRKERILLGVGRFIGSGHVKRQDLLVETFRTLCDGGLEGWELHLAGGVHEDAVHAGYFDAIARRAAGYPVVLHPDASYAAIHDLYARASIFWHAAGFGAAAGDPAALEHFGMTTAEAMAAGAVPVVHAAGGQVEVVREGEGVLWRTITELEAETLRLIADPARRRRLGETAAAGARRYSRERFRERMLGLLGPIVEELSD